MTETTVKTTDAVVRFLFDNHGVRGEIVALNESATRLIENHHYAAPVKRLMQELSACASLMAATVKTNTRITVQMQGGKNAKLKYALVNVAPDLSFYGSAVPVEGVKIEDSAAFKDLVGENGSLIISVFPEDGERYQGVVGLDKDNVAAALEDYFLSSEQLPTRFFILSDPKGNGVYGILLQIIPNIDGNRDSLEHLSVLTATMSFDEMDEVGIMEALRRLYAEETVRVFKERKVSFRCVCSRERGENTLTSLPRKELEEIAADPHGTTLTCAHCQRSYHFTKEELEALLLKVSQ